MYRRLIKLYSLPAYILLATLTFFIPHSSLAMEKFSIAAVVGDEAITKNDIKERLILALVSSGLPNTPEVRNKLIPQVLRLLIDEKLYRKEANDFNLYVDESEIEDAFRTLEVQNNLPADGLDEFMSSQGIDKSVLKEQITVELLKNKLLSKKIRPAIKITEKEIDEKMENISSESGLMEFNLSEIILPIDSASEEDNIKDLANELVSEIKNGKKFTSIARAFSRSSSAAKGGNLGWIQPDQLPFQVRNKIVSMERDEISEPIRSAEGYYIVRLKDKRALIASKKDETEIGMKQIFIPLKEDLNVVEKRQLLNRLRQSKAEVQSCEAFDEFANKVHSTIEPKLMMTQLKSLKPEIREAIADLPLGAASPVVEGNNGLHVFILCERIEATNVLARRNQIKNLLFRKKFTLQSKRYIRDLQNSTFIEIRI